MNTTMLAQQILNGLAVGSVYALFALGYTLVFSVLRVINFTQGAIFALGAYFTYLLTGSAFGFNGLLGQPGAPLWPALSRGSPAGRRAGRAWWRWGWSASPSSPCGTKAPTRC